MMRMEPWVESGRISSMRCSLLIALVASLSLVPAAGSEAADELAPSLAPAQLQALRAEGNAPLVVDVRTSSEFQSGHVSGAVNVPHDELADRLHEVRSETGVVLYCMIGPRARLGEDVLRKAGVQEIFHLEGGFAAWRESGLPTETGSD